MPDTDIPCVWFECRYQVGSGDHSTFIEKKTEQSFLVDDDTGTCRIDPFNMEIIPNLSKSRLWFISAHGLIYARWIGIGEKVHVYGKFTTMHVDYSKQVKDLKKSRLKALKADRELMMKFDENNDGVISIKEWEAVTRIVEKEVDDYIFEKQKQHKHQYAENVIRPPDDPKLPYLLSAHKELNVVRRFILSALVYFLLFFIFVIVIVIYIV